MSLSTLDAPEFRRRLAGLADAAGGEDMTPAEYRQRAADVVLLLAVCFNREKLDAKTLWTRIESAIKRALEETSGGNDLERFLHVALDHVLASPNVALSDGPAAMQDELLALDDDSRVHLLVYLSAHLYPAMVHGRRLWQEHKATKRGAE